jgi:hypothetical protein
MYYENDSSKAILSELEELMQIATATEKTCRPLPHAEIQK